MRRDKLIAISILLFISTLLPNASQSQTNTWQRDLADWRAQHALELQKPDGWFALVGLEWLKPGDNSFGSAADNQLHLPAAAPAHLGVLRLQGTTVILLPPPATSATNGCETCISPFSPEFLVDGKQATLQTLHTDVDDDKKNPRLNIGSVLMYVIRRGNRYGLRIKDSKSAALVGFHGLNWFPPDAKYRVTARWIPYSPQKTTSLATLIGTHYSQPVPGAAEFTLAGKIYRLEPVIEDPAEAKLFFIIRDTTSKSTTYGACRFLYTDYPVNGLTQSGDLELDFNKLENPPCAYTPFATCPLPPPGNRLAIPIPAGEKRYHD